VASHCQRLNLKLVTWRDRDRNLPGTACAAWVHIGIMRPRGYVHAANTRTRTVALLPPCSHTKALSSQKVNQNQQIRAQGVKLVTSFRQSPLPLATVTWNCAGTIGCAKGYHPHCHVSILTLLILFQTMNISFMPSCELIATHIRGPRTFTAVLPVSGSFI
jgi:hypothetical protein